jgi:hypothetical protein
MSKQNNQYKGRDHYSMKPGDTEYYAAPCCYSGKQNYGKDFGPLCYNPVEKYTAGKQCSCYGTPKNYGTAKTCSCKNLPTAKEALTGVI